MKKPTITLALLAVLSLVNTGCQKETIVEPRAHDVAEENSTACVMLYSVDGVAGRTAVKTPAERAAFIRWIVGLAEEGHRVIFRQEGNTVNVLAPKDTQTYSSKKKHEVEMWADEMIQQGYTVVIEYDKDTGYYTGTATKEDK